jgi:hypothetical protein
MFDMYSDLPQSEEYLMRHFKTVGLAVTMALVLVACVGATSASATTICVGGAITGPCTDGHPGGTVVLSSSNSQLGVSGGSTIQCTSSIIHGVAPATSSTWLQIPVTLGYSGCTAFGIFTANVTVHPSCQHRVTLDVMFRNVQDSEVVVTLPTNCTFTVSVPAISCNVTIHGPDSFGATWTNGNASTKSSAIINNATLHNVTVHPGGGFGCPTAGAHHGLLSGTYTVQTPAAAPGVTVIN